MSQQTDVSKSQNMLIGVICQLQYRVAKLEGHSEEDARQVAKRLAAVIIADVSGADPEVIFSEKVVASEEMQTTLSNLGQSVDEMIDSVGRLYGDFDKSI